MEFLILEVDDARFGIPTSDVREVLRAASLGAPPKRFPNMIGMLNYRGQILGVLQPGGLRGPAAHPLTPLDHLIVLQSDGREFALRVDRAVEIMTWDETPPPARPTALEDELAGDGMRPIAHPRLGLVHLLDTRVLWNDLQLDRGHQPTPEVEVR